MKVNFQCKECKERHPGCHGNCESYIAEKKRIEEIKERLKPSSYDSYRRELSKKISKQRNKR